MLRAANHRRSNPPTRFTPLACWLAPLSALTLLAVAGAGLALQGSKPPQAEMSGSESTFKITAERNLVVVRVVARDPDGKAVTGLRKEDFRLFDNGKLQTISTFSVESPEAKAPASAGRPAAPAPAGAPAQPSQPSGAAEAVHPFVVPDRFVALFFDDIHIAYDDLVRTLDAALRYVSTNLGPADRVGLFATSGVTHLDFTADREKLRSALIGLRQQPRMGTVGGPTQASSSSSGAGSQSAQAVLASELASRGVLLSLQELCRRMVTLPGQRSIVLLSPGFMTWTPLVDAGPGAVYLASDVDQAIGRALRAGVVINAFDVRGLYTDLASGDASQKTPEAPSSPGESTFAWQAAQQMLINGTFATHAISMMEQTNVLVSLATGTGGAYFHNSNDYDAGFRRTGGLPETAYVLTFSPQNLKYDGSFHRLKVTLANPSKLTLQARFGYYAPRKGEDTEARAKDEIEEAAFSHDEIHVLPLEVHTRFFKTDTLNARLTVLARVDANSVQFRKLEDRSLGSLILVAALFDSDGNFLNGSETTLDMRLLDQTLKKIQRGGVSLKANLDTKVGTYLLRIVVRDSESGSMSAVNRAIEIPY
jgi:VWFA-related protein